MIIQGNALAIPLKDKSVQTVVTSPPYWGLRDYGTAKWDGGDAECDHRQRSQAVIDKSDETRTTGANAMSNHAAVPFFKDRCGKCGATRIDNQLGLEPTPEAYVAKMVEVFREVKRVLRDDGTIWVNLGDSYASDPGKGGSGTFNGRNGRGEKYAREMRRGSGRADGLVTDESPRNRDGAPPCGLPAKNLIGIPWRVAFALQADGWYLRSDIIWSKPNPMPESVTDRPTKAHEYLFLLAKSERYYFDADAVKEPSITNDPRRPYTSQGAWEMDGRPIEQRHGGKVRSPAGWKTGPGSHGSIHENGREQEVTYVDDTFTKRNIRSVWTIATQPYPEAHFATFPEDLIKPCILAGCPVGGIVLDPFSGSGTTVKVAQDLGRVGVGLELSAEYIKLAQRRAAQWGLGI